MSFTVTIFEADQPFNIRFGKTVEQAFAIIRQSYPDIHGRFRVITSENGREDVEDLGPYDSFPSNDRNNTVRVEFIPAKQQAPATALTPPLAPDYESNLVNLFFKVLYKDVKSPTCPSMSKFGEMEKVRYKSATFTTTNTDPVIQPTDPFFNENYPNEESMNDKLFKTLISLTEIRDLEDDIIVVNSERTLWLIDSTVDETKRKPDFLRIHKGFYKPAAHPHGTDHSLHYGGVLLPFVNQVLFIYEGKVDSIKGNGNIGVALNYINLACNASVLDPRGLLFNKQDLIAIDYDRMTLFSGQWTTTSRQELTKFILDAKHPPLTAALIKSCNKLNVKCCLGGYISEGAAGCAFRVKGNADKVMVLKVCCNKNDDPRFQSSIRDEFHRGVNAFQSVPDLVVPVLGWCVEDNYGAILYGELGLPVRYVFSRRVKLLTLLANFHLTGFIHGDARLPNIVEYDGTLKFIDFATCVKWPDYNNDLSAVQAVISDISTLIKSCEWNVQIVSDKIENYAKAVCGTYQSKEEQTKVVEEIVTLIADSIIEKK